MEKMNKIPEIRNSWNSKFPLNNMEKWTKFPKFEIPIEYHGKMEKMEEIPDIQNSH